MNILDKIGIKSLNPMQVAVGKEITSSQKDVVILSPTGTGKTLAYMLPLQEQLDRDDINVQMLVIVPGRELALQSHEVLQNMKCGLRSMACYGGRATMDEHRRMREVNPQVVFATPGRLLDHLEKGNILCDSVQVIVIDEFDKCLEMGFACEMSAILGFVSDDCRRVLLSATDMDDIPRSISFLKTNRQTTVLSLLSCIVRRRISLAHWLCSFLTSEQEPLADRLPPSVGQGKGPLSYSSITATLSSVLPSILNRKASVMWYFTVDLTRNSVNRLCISSPMALCR